MNIVIMQEVGDTIKAVNLENPLTFSGLYQR